MKIRPKIFVLLAAVFSVLCMLQYLVERQFLLPAFARLERQAAQQDMDRVVNALDRDRETLSVTARDWGNWSETWNFLKDRDAGFVAVNLNEDALASLRVSALAFYDTAGDVVWSAGRDRSTRRPLAIDLLTPGRLDRADPLRTAIRSGRPRSGLVSTNLGPMLVVLAPVLDGHFMGPFRGMVLLGQLISDEEIARIGQQAQVRLSRAPAPSAAALLRGQPQVLIEHDTMTEVYRAFPDISGAAALTLRIDAPRTISAQGREVVGYVSASLAVIGASMLAVILVLLNRVVLSPLARITQHAVRIGRDDDLSARLSLRRKDEFGQLAREFDRMVADLADARRRLLDQSYDAGVAENASGVLHNLGNALTPLCVNASRLRDTLRTAPTADIERALAELERGTTDDSRTAELESFLRLAGRELSASVAAARERVEKIVRGTETIQSIVAAQRPASRAFPVLEPVQLTEFLNESADLVPPDLRERLTLDIDPSVKSVGIVWLVRLTLKQVVQNLIVNAAEAARDRGRLTVAARILPSAAGTLLELTFADDGAGIAAAHLPRLFERGFSTKARAGNAGVGLHWCATAVTALGGRLRAESAGDARGAIFHLQLPLRRTSVVDDARVA